MTPLERVRNMVIRERSALLFPYWDKTKHSRIQGQFQAYSNVLDFIFALDETKTAARPTLLCPVEFEEGEG